PWSGVRGSGRRRRGGGMRLARVLAAPPRGVARRPIARALAPPLALAGISPGAWPVGARVEGLPLPRRRAALGRGPSGPVPDAADRVPPVRDRTVAGLGSVTDRGLVVSVSMRAPVPRIRRDREPLPPRGGQVADVAGSRLPAVPGPELALGQG